MYKSYNIYMDISESDYPVLVGNSHDCDKLLELIDIYLEMDEELTEDNFYITGVEE